jgi:glycosyltransferase involved in cell wall biosynthesis
VVDFTIITPVFNGEDYLESTIISVLNSASGSSFEYIIIDDGSTDNTKHICDRYSNELIYIYQQNAGQASAINRAFDIAHGNYVTIVNADDLIISNELFILAKTILDERNDLVGLYPDWNLIDQFGSKIETRYIKDFSVDEMVGNFNCLVGPGGVFRLEAALNVGGWEKNFRYVPDYDFWLKLLKFGDFLHIPKVLAEWRTHDNSLSIANRGVNMSQERIQVISDHIERHPDLDNKLVRKAIGNSYYRAAVLSYFERNVDGRRLFLKSLKNYPSLLLKKNILVTVYLLTFPFSFNLISKMKSLFVIQDVEQRIRRKLIS